MLTGGEVHDSVMMQPALEQLTIKGSTVLADKAYGSKDNRAYITEQEAEGQADQDGDAGQTRMNGNG